jgi:hypothetical protein
VITPQSCSIAQGAVPHNLELSCEPLDLYKVQSDRHKYCVLQRDAKGRGVRGIPHEGRLHGNSMEIPRKLHGNKSGNARASTWHNA